MGCVATANSAYAYERGGIMGRKPGTSQSQERVTLAFDVEAVQRLRLRFDGIGVVQIGKMDSATSHAVFKALMSQTPAEVRDELENDDMLDLSDVDTWFYILNEIARAGVKLSVV
jgi:hypothetical protein